MTTVDNAIMSEAGERYARALFDLAEEAGAAEAVEKDVDARNPQLGPHLGRRLRRRRRLGVGRRAGRRDEPVRPPDVGNV